MKYKVKAKYAGERRMRVVYTGTSLNIMMLTACKMLGSSIVTDCEVTIIDHYGKEEVTMIK